MRTAITDAEWATFKDEGYLRLGQIVDSQELSSLQERIDAIMQGSAAVPYDRMRLQLDSTTGEYEDMPPQTIGHKGATLAYRKIQQLEFDPCFLAYMQKQFNNDICDRQYGRGLPIAIYRAMFMNKPAGRGTKLPWHMDNFPDVNLRPVITVWMALDESTIANGCVEVLPGSHRHYPEDDDTVFLDNHQIEEALARYDPITLECQAGEGFLLHNRLLHTSGINHTSGPRRAFSACYMDARSVSRSGEPFSMVFGDGALRREDVGAAMVDG
jgi:phytanoyl-CoA hydroxylase